MLAFIAAYFLRQQQGIFTTFLKQPDFASFPPYDEYLVLCAAAAVVFLFILSLFRLYSLKVSERLGAELGAIFFATIVWLMAVITYYFLIREFPFSRLVLFYAAAFLFLFVSAGRVIIKKIQRMLLKKGIGRRTLVFVGENSIAQELKENFEREGSAKIIGIAQNVAELKKLLHEKRDIEEIIQTQDDHVQAEEIIELCREYQLQYHFVPDLLEVHRTNIEISAVSGMPLISLRPTPLDGWGKVGKRIFDFVGAGLGIIILSPIFLAIAAAIKIDSAGTVFFRYLDDGEPALRIGEKGRKFQCLKFRTMKMGTHNLRYTELQNRNVRKGSPLVKIARDPRVTRVGRFLRRFSLDELPQLWNVFTGEMSLVGPRPHLPEEVAKYERHHKFVLTIKPGLSGLAQISGRSDLPFEEEVRLDSYYIENWSLLLDLKILIKTIFVVVKPYRE